MLSDRRLRHKVIIQRGFYYDDIISLNSKVEKVMWNQTIMQYLEKGATEFILDALKVH